MASPKKPHNDQRMERPNALYSINNQKTAAGLDALLYGAPEDLDSLTEFLSINRVILGNGGFCLLVAKIQFQPEHGIETLMDANGKFAELLEEELVRRTIYYMVPLRGLVLCLIAMPQYRQGSKRLLVTNERLYEGGVQAAERFHSLTGMNILAAISPTCFGLESLPGTFHRTVDLLEFYNFFGNTSGICRSPANLPKRHIRISSKFQEWCSGALNLLLSEQREEFFRYVEHRLMEIKDLVPCSLQQYRTLSYQYLDLLCYNLVNHHLADISTLERTDLFWLVNTANSFPELFQRIRDLICQLDTPLASNSRHNSAIMVDKMKAYIQLHHTESDLTISAVANEFQMTQPIFSACFIKYTGTGPLEYLNKLRIQTALELLKTTDDTLPQIAQNAGFGSVSTLHRVFKKSTGITPAQARKGNN